MAVNVTRGTSDAEVAAIAKALGPFTASHPQAAVDLYRQGQFSIRVRIVDPAFARMSVPERHDLVWGFLDGLPDDVLSDLSMLVLLTPEEQRTSGANLEFDDPVPQVLL